MPPDTKPQGILRRAVLTAAAALLLTVASGDSASAQEYRLQPGDVIEMAIVGLPEMGARSSIQIDGSLSLPEIGDIDAAGRTIAEIRERIRTALASRLLRVYLPDGTEVTRMVNRDQVTASVVEYRPVFVSGDVALPGERVFRPGMTARQVIAASGGVTSADLLVQGYNPAGLRADYAGAWYAATAAAARVWRLKQELGDDQKFDRSVWPPAPEPGGALDRTLRVESDILAARAQNYRQEGLFLNEQLDQIESQTTVLQRQLEAEKAGEQSTAEDLEKATQANEKGLLTQSRMQDVRGAALFASTRRLQTEVNLMQLERRRTEISREIERRAEVRRLDLLDELQKARIVESRERARLLSTAAQLRATGVAPAPPPEGADIPQISIIRNGAEILGPVTYETRVEPGDVVEVRRTTTSPTNSLAESGLEPETQAAAALQ